MSEYILYNGCMTVCIIHTLTMPKQKLNNTPQKKKKNTKCMSPNIQIKY